MPNTRHECLPASISIGYFNPSNILFRLEVIWTQLFLILVAHLGKDLQYQLIPSPSESVCPTSVMQMNIEVSSSKNFIIN